MSCRRLKTDLFYRPPLTPSNPRLYSFRPHHFQFPWIRAKKVQQKKPEPSPFFSNFLNAHRDSDFSIHLPSLLSQRPLIDIWCAIYTLNQPIWVPLNYFPIQKYCSQLFLPDFLVGVNETSLFCAIEKISLPQSSNNGHHASVRTFLKAIACSRDHGSILSLFCFL